MTSFQQRLLAVWIGLAVVSGCQTETERAIVVRAYSDEATVTFRVTAIQRGANAHRESATRAATIPPGSPMQAIVFASGDAPLLLHLEADSATGVKRYATRCFDASLAARAEIYLEQLTNDEDADGFGADPLAQCLDRDSVGARVPCSNPCNEPLGSDCNEANAIISPLAEERDDTCSNGVDEDCDGIDLACGDADGDSFVACGPARSAECDCDDTIASVFPGADDLCGDGVDSDCDGRDALCDRDGDGYVADRALGGRPDCDDGNAEIHPGATETCEAKGLPPEDDDCNGLADELSECIRQDLDRDGFDACVGDEMNDCDCNDCDSGVHPRATERCDNLVDEDCDGQDAPCRSGDLDHDGYSNAAAGGPDCDDSNARVFPGAPEDCTTPVSESCRANEDCTADTDGDHFVESGACEGDPQVHPWASELCNAIDDNCNLTADEGLTLGGETACVAGVPLDFRTDLDHCGGCRRSCRGSIADACVEGECRCGSTAQCSGLFLSVCCDGGCTNLDDDAQNCGACGVACDDRSDACTDGECTCGDGTPCVDGRTCCGGECVDLDVDANDCGACGVECGANAHCADRSCICDSSYLDCDETAGCEVDSRTDTLHCGECTRVCTFAHAESACVESSCALTSCLAGYADCNPEVEGCETSTLTTDNCGGCGVSCGVGETCTEGRACACGATENTSASACAAGTYCCEGACVDDAVRCGK